MSVLRGEKFMYIEEFIPIIAAFFFIGGVIITVPVLMSQIAKHRPVRAASSADAYLAANETQIAAKEDAFLKTNTTRRELTSNLSSGGTGGIGRAGGISTRPAMRSPGRRR